MRSISRGRFRHVIPVLAMACVQAVATAYAAPARDKVKVAGSSTLFPYAAAVAEAFGRQGKWKTPVVESLGTGGGFQLFCAGLGNDTPDITDASRPISDREAAECNRRGVGAVVALRVGLDGMLLASLRTGPDFSLTREQLYLALAREVPLRGKLVMNPYRRWREISPRLPDLPIQVYGPAPNHGTRDAFVALALAPACERFAEIRAVSPVERQRLCQTLRTDGAWTDVSGDYAMLYSRLIENPRALGVLGFSYLENHADRIKAARVDGVDPSPESISNWKYPLARPLFLYVKQAHVGAIPGLAEFVQEFLSERAIGPEGYLAERGLTPLPPAMREAERNRARQLLRQTR